MYESCRRIIEYCNSWWTFIGWSMFAGIFIFSFTPVAVPFTILCFFLLLVWWLIDAVDQSVPVWQVVTGIAMMAIGMLPRGGVLFIAAWVIYWTRVRE